MVLHTFQDNNQQTNRHINNMCNHQHCIEMHYVYRLL